MSRIVDDVRSWNTPILGSYILWRFTQGYTVNHRNGESPVMLLHFIASAVLTNPRLIEPITNKRNGLSSYVRSFNDKKDIDILLSIQNRILSKRKYTLSALDLAAKHGLLVLNPADARVYPKDVRKRASRGSALNSEAKIIGNKAETLGKWFSEYELYEVASMFQVVL